MKKTLLLSTLLLSVCVLFLYSILAQFQFVAGQNEKTIDPFEIKKSVPQQENATEKKCSTDTAPQTQNKQNPKIDPRYVALLEKRVELSKENLSDAKMAFDHSVVYYDVYAEANNISIDAEMALYRYVGKRKELIVALEEKLKVVKEMCSRVESLKAHGAPGGTVLAFNKARLAVIDVELELFREKELQSSSCETKTNEAKNPLPKQENATEKILILRIGLIKSSANRSNFRTKIKPTRQNSTVSS
jgi:hypothetical protein